VARVQRDEDDPCHAYEGGASEIDRGVPGQTPQGTQQVVVGQARLRAAA